LSAVVRQAGPAQNMFVDVSTRKVGVFRRVWVTFSANFRGKGHRPTTNVGIRKLE